MESSLASGLLSAGVDIAMLGPVPTPAVSYFCRTSNAMAGIVISASHNPVQDNGLKVLSATGGKLSSDIELAIEKKMQNSISSVAIDKLGKARRIDQASEIYADYLCETASVSLEGLKIVVDCANGAYYRIAPQVLENLGANVVAIASKPDGYNINHNCGSTNTELIRRKTLEHGADVGIALDGDGDRVMMVDAGGNLIDGDQILYVIAIARKRKGELKGGVVGTLLSNIGLAKALQSHGIPFKRVNVGDRNISKKLEKLNWNLGGETCGHILNGNITSPGDGMVASIEVLSEIVRCGKSLGKLVANIQLVSQVSIDVHMKNRTAPISNFNSVEWPSSHRAVEKAEIKIGNSGRVLLRASGTEPVIRILVEGEEQKQIKQIANQLADVVRLESDQFL